MAAGRYGIRRSVPHDIIHLDRTGKLLAFTKEEMEHEAGALLMREIEDKIMVVRKWYREYPNYNDTYPCQTLELILDLTEAETMRVRIAELPAFHFNRPFSVETVEWQCEFCGLVNLIDATYCGEKHEHAVGCGHPRKRMR